MSLKYSKEEIIKKFKDINFEIISDYITFDNQISIKCIICNNIVNYHSSRQALLYGKCKKCIQHRVVYTKERIENICLNLNYNLIDIDFNGSNSKLLLSCKKCCYERKVIYVPNLVRFPNCKKCWGKRRALEFKQLREQKPPKIKQVPKNGKRNTKFSLEEIKELCNKIGYTFLDNFYENANTNYNFLCPNKHKINIKFCKILTYIKENRKGCSFCNDRFQNEKLTGIFLKELLPNTEIIKNLKLTTNIIYNNKIQKTAFVDYTFKIKDKIFYLEYNGAQHYRPVNFGAKNINEDRFIRQQTRDQWLREYCIANNIILIEIDGRQIYGHKIKDYLKNQLKMHINND